MLIYHVDWKVAAYIQGDKKVLLQMFIKHFLIIKHSNQYKSYIIRKRVLFSIEWSKT